MEELLKLLKNSNLKLVEKETGIPYDRMYKWSKGLATPKAKDYSTLLNYFNVTSSSNGKVSNEHSELSQESNITQRLNEENNNFRLNDSKERGSFYKALPIKQQNSTTDMPPDILKWVDPNHAPIPVYDLAEGITSISELLVNDAFKPTVILLKGHLGCNAVVRHVDKAMNKDFPPRCQLGVQRLFDFKKRIVPGMAAIIVLNELTVTRYVYDADNTNEFLLRSSEAEKFPDMVVEKDEVKEMWKIKSLTPLPDIILF